MDQTIDVYVSNEGSVFAFQPVTEAAKQWIAASVQDAQWFGGSVVVEHRYARDLAAGMIADGLVLR